MEESNQIIQLLNNENTTFKNISYKSVDRIKLNNINNNSFSNNKFSFNAKSIASQLVLYKDSYILLEVDIDLYTDVCYLDEKTKLIILKTLINLI